MPSTIELRDVTDGDIRTFYDHMQDAEAQRMAAFVSKDPSDLEAHTAHWQRLLGNDAIIKKTIVCDGAVAGHVVGFEREGDPEVTYWIARDQWGRGIATAALAEFLGHMPKRPVYARTAKDNAASIRVLEKCGFAITGEDRGFANARGEEIEEYILALP